MPILIKKKINQLSVLSYKIFVKFALMEIKSAVPCCLIICFHTETCKYHNTMHASILVLKKKSINNDFLFTNK